MLKKDNNPKTIKMTDSMKDFLLEIPHHALIYFKKEEAPVRYEEDYAAVCAFIQNAQLAAWSYGVGMLWTITPYMHDPGFAKDIGLDSDEMKIAAVMQIGYPEKVSQRLFSFQDRKSTRLNSSHVAISYAVFCLQHK